MMTENKVLCRLHPRGHSDDAKRCADAVNLHFYAIGWQCVGKWVAIRLSDGGSDGVLYDDMGAAVRHQSDANRCHYVKMISQMMDHCDAEILLTFYRRAYDAGFKMKDPDARNGGKQLLMPHKLEDQVRALRLLKGV